MRATQVLCQVASRNETATPFEFLVATSAPHVAYKPRSMLPNDTFGGVSLLSHRIAAADVAPTTSLGLNHGASVPYKTLGTPGSRICLSRPEGCRRCQKGWWGLVKGVSGRASKINQKHT